MEADKESIGKKTENYYENFYDEKTSDKIINFFVKRVLLIRGSKKLFSTYENAKNYLDSIKDNQPLYEISPDLKTSCEIKKEVIDGVNCYTFRDKNSHGKKYVFYFHGGAYAREPSSTHFSLVDKLAQKSGANLIFVCYGKTPTYDYKYTYSVAKKLFEKLLGDGVSPEDIVLMGDSAGGSIAINLCEYFEAEGLPKVSQVIAFSPMCDLNMTNERIPEISKRDPMLASDGLAVFAEKWVGDSDFSNSLINPMNVKIESLPKLTFFSGTNEILEPDAEKLVELVNENGGDAQLNVYSGMYHDFVLYPLQSAKQVIEITSELLNA